MESRGCRERSRTLDLPAVGLLTGATLVVAACVVLAWPGSRPLVALGLYKIASQVTTVLFIEPAILYFAKMHSAALVTAAVAVGCLVGGVLDYWLLGPLLNHATVRKHYCGKSWYETSVRWFGVAPAFTIAAAALTPLPFLPFKGLAITSGYPMERYIASMTLARVPRTYVIAAFGRFALLSDWIIGLVFILLLAVWMVCRVRSKQHTAPHSALDDA